MKTNWQTKKLGEICIVDWGNTNLTKKSYVKNGKYLACSAAGCDGRIDHKEHSKYTPVLSAIGAQCGRMFFPEEDFTAIKNTITLTPKTEIVDNKFLFQLFNSITLPQRGAGQPFISKGDIEKFEISLPTLSEQKRIVKILDEAFEKIKKAKENAEENLRNSKELFESYLQNIFSNSGKDWEEKKLSEICEKITDGTHQTPTYYDKGFVFLSSRNVTSGKIDWERIKYIDEKQHFEMHKRVSPRINDILLAKNGTTGVAAMVDRDINFDIYVSLALLRAREMMSPQFLLYFINSPVAKKQFNKRLKGSGVPNLHLEEIREVIINFPKSLSEQKSIVKKLDGLSVQTKKLEEVYKKKIVDLEELKKSILRKAFAGEL